MQRFANTNCHCRQVFILNTAYHLTVGRGGGHAEDIYYIRRTHIYIIYIHTYVRTKVRPWFEDRVVPENDHRWAYYPKQATKQGIGHICLQVVDEKLQRDASKP